MDKIAKELLKQIADLEGVPQGAYNIRMNGQGIDRHCTEEIQIVPKTDKPGIDIFVKPNTTNKSVHIPVIITKGGLCDLVYNDFYIGENCDVTIIAGCGIHNCTSTLSEHDGIHTFHVKENAKVKYVEKHLGIGGQNSERVLNPTTKVFLAKNSQMELETLQLGGVNFADRKTYAKVGENARLTIKEKISTDGEQIAKTYFSVVLSGKKSFVDVSSRSVAKDRSSQKFVSKVVGKNECFGHVECDGILIDNAKITSCPQIVAHSVDSTLVHEAAIGKIAGDQLTKLMSLGLTREQAEKEIINSFML